MASVLIVVVKYWRCQGYGHVKGKATMCAYSALWPGLALVRGSLIYMTAELILGILPPLKL